MGFELLVPSPARRAASEGHVCAVAKRVTALPPDRMSGTSDTAKNKNGHGPSTSASASLVALLCLRPNLLNLLLLFSFSFSSLV